MITREEIQKIAKLSKLEFTDKEYENLEGSMNDILKHMELMNEVDTENVEPLYNVNEITEGITREDKVENKVKREDFLANSPETDGEYVILPKIVG